MLENLPASISVTFIATTLLTLAFIYLAVKQSSSEQTRSKVNIILLCLLGWLVLQAVLTLNNFYNTDTRIFPPKFPLLILPAVLTILILFLTKGGRAFIDSLPLSTLTKLHIVRIPVELVLYWLFLHKAIPQLMTFEGRNFDILSGLSAPFIASFGFQRMKLSNKFILGWNVICLLLLFNIVINAALSAPFSFQQFGFEQPNIAVLYFPFSWLPCFVVPAVLFSHLVSIRQLLKK